MKPDDTTKRLQALCAEVGFELRALNAAVVARLGLLAERTETIADCERMVARAWTIFHYYLATKPHEAFSDAERRIVVLGCVFSDIGKTGPGHADAGAQRLIADMFAIEGVEDETQPVSRFLSTYFPLDSDERARRFRGLGLDPGMAMRQFWNLHCRWTLEILEGGGVPPEAVAAAATHHLLDDVNPDAIVGADHRFTRSFGNNTTFDRAEKLVILLDKYDAVRRRGRQNHDQAIAWLSERVENSPSFRRDEELRTLIVDLDHAFRT